MAPKKSTKKNVKKLARNATAAKKQTVKQTKQIKRTSKAAKKAVKQIAKAFSKVKKSLSPKKSAQKRQSKSQLNKSASKKSPSKNQLTKPTTKKSTQKRITKLQLLKLADPKNHRTFNEWAQAVKDHAADFERLYPGYQFAANYMDGQTYVTYDADAVDLLVERLESYDASRRFGNLTAEQDSNAADLIDSVSLIKIEGSGIEYRKEVREKREERQRMNNETVKEARALVGSKEDNERKSPTSLLRGVVGLLKESDARAVAAEKRADALEKKFAALMKQLTKPAKKRSTKKSIKKATSKSSTKKGSKKNASKSSTTKRSTARKPASKPGTSKARPSNAVGKKPAGKQTKKPASKNATSKRAVKGKHGIGKAVKRSTKSKRR